MHIGKPAPHGVQYGSVLPAKREEAINFCSFARYSKLFKLWWHSSPENRTLFYEFATISKVLISCLSKRMRFTDTLYTWAEPWSTGCTVASCHRCQSRPWDSVEQALGQPLALGQPTASPPLGYLQSFIDHSVPNLLQKIIHCNKVWSRTSNVGHKQGQQKPKLGTPEGRVSHCNQVTSVFGLTQNPQHRRKRPLCWQLVKG